VVFASDVLDYSSHVGDQLGHKPMIRRCNTQGRAWHYAAIVLWLLFAISAACRAGPMPSAAPQADAALHAAHAPSSQASVHGPCCQGDTGCCVDRLVVQQTSLSGLAVVVAQAGAWLALPLVLLPLRARQGPRPPIPRWRRSHLFFCLFLD
jgi:hypothetical protein